MPGIFGSCHVEVVTVHAMKTYKECRGVAPLILNLSTRLSGDRGSTVVKVLCYKSDGRWFDPSWCQWIFY